MKDELNHIFYFDFLHQSLKQLFLFLMELTATFISGPASLLNNDPKNPPDWIILEIWALESFKSVDILFFVLLSVTIHEADHSHQAFWKKFSELLLFYLWWQFSVASVVYPTIWHLLCCIEPFILFTELFLLLCKILALLLLIFLKLHTLVS